MTRTRSWTAAFALTVFLALAGLLGSAGAASAAGDGGDAPDWCFRANSSGELPTCTWDGQRWHRSYEGVGGLQGSGGGAGDGFEATYLAANLRGKTDPPVDPPASPGATTPSVAERLRQLQELRDQGLITPGEYDARRAAIIDSV